MGSANGIARRTHSQETAVCTFSEIGLDQIARSVKGNQKVSSFQVVRIPSVKRTHSNEVCELQTAEVLPSLSSKVSDPFALSHPAFTGSTAKSTRACGDNKAIDLEFQAQCAKAPTGKSDHGSEPPLRHITKEEAQLPGCIAREHGRSKERQHAGRSVQQPSKDLFNCPRSFRVPAVSKARSILVDSQDALIEENGDDSLVTFRSADEAGLCASREADGFERRYPTHVDDIAHWDNLRRWSCNAIANSRDFMAYIEYSRRQANVREWTHQPSR
jgi:hypothetical protein